MKYENWGGEAVAGALALLCTASAVAAPPATAPKGIPPSSTRGQPADSLHISVRPNGVLSPGQTVEITIDGNPRNTPVDGRVVSPDAPVLLTFKKLPFTTSITIPKEFVGSFEISAVMSDKPNTAWFSKNPASGEKALLVKVPAALQRIKVEPTDVSFEKPGEESVLYVSGYYADGIERRLESSSAGTRYTTSNPGVVSVSSKDGRLRAESLGTAVVTVENGGIVVAVSVVVYPDTPVLRLEHPPPP